jgi:hypothetical protein
MSKVKKTYEGKLSEAELGRLEEQIEERLNPNQIQRFRQTCKAMGGGQRRHPYASVLSECSPAILQRASRAAEG